MKISMPKDQNILIEDEPQRPIGQLRFETKQLVDRLSNLAQNVPSSFELVTYSELSGLIGRNVQGKARANLMTARRKVLRDHHIVIGVVLDKGVKRLTDEEIVKSGACRVQHINRTSIRGMQEQIQVDFEKLDRQKQREYNITLSTLQLARLMTGAKAQRKISEATERTPLKPHEMLRLFGGKP